MTIRKVEFFRYILKLKAPVRIKTTDIPKRPGFMIKVTDSEGRTGWGDIAPLPGFSRETVADVIGALPGVRKTLPGSTFEEIERLDGAISRRLVEPWPASVRFGVESALLMLRAKEREISMRELLGVNPTHVPLNVLITGTGEEILARVNRVRDEGYRAVKMKVGRMSLGDEVELVKEVRALLPDEVALRLDANQAWSSAQARDFLQGMRDQAIEYIEEPCTSIEESARLAAEFGIPIAIDESLLGVLASDSSIPDGISVVVIKPGLIGGLEQTKQLSAIHSDKKIVLSSCFESQLGILMLAHFAAIVSPDVPAGLETVTRFDGSVLTEAVTIEDGEIVLPERLPDIDETALIEATDV